MWIPDEYWTHKNEVYMWPLDIKKVQICFALRIHSILGLDFIIDVHVSTILWCLTGIVITCLSLTAANTYLVVTKLDRWVYSNTNILSICCKIYKVNKSVFSIHFADLEFHSAITNDILFCLQFNEKPSDNKETLQVVCYTQGTYTQSARFSENTQKGKLVFI